MRHTISRLAVGSLIFLMAGCAPQTPNPHGDGLAHKNEEISSTDIDVFDEDDVLLLDGLEKFDYKLWASAYCSIAAASTKDNKKCEVILKDCNKAHQDIGMAGKLVKDNKAAIKKRLVQEKVNKKQLVKCLERIPHANRILVSARCGDDEKALKEIKAKTAQVFPDEKSMDQCFKSMLLTVDVISRSRKM